MNHTLAIARSFLFVPGNRPDRFGKAAASTADAIILDLEDAVSAGGKDQARESVVSWLEQANAIVRINSFDSPLFSDDLSALAGLPGLRGIVLAKLENVDAVRAARELVSSTVPLIGLIESAVGIRDASAIASETGLQRLMFGNLDFCLDSGIKPSSRLEPELLYARSAMVIASRAARIAPPVDGVYPAIDDPSGLSASARHAFELGFTGKLCIHPVQVDSVHEAFRPSEQELAWAKRISRESRASTGGAIRVDGEMVDAPRVAQAHRIIALADQD